MLGTEYYILLRQTNNPLFRSPGLSAPLFRKSDTKKEATGLPTFQSLIKNFLNQ